MLSSISPFGERNRNSRWWLTVTAYLLGSLAGGMTTGLAMGFAGELLSGAVDGQLALTLLAVVAAVGVAADLGVAGLELPSPRRQVNEDWLTTYRGWVYGLGFGYQLGLGVVTIVSSSTVWLTWVAALLAGSWGAGLAIGAVFGAARGALILSTATIHDPASLRALFRRIARHAPSVNRSAIAVAGLTALTALGGALA